MELDLSIHIVMYSVFLKTGCDTSSSWRRSAPSWSVTNSRLPNRKVWEGGNGGGAHDPLQGIAGNSKEPKRIVSPWLTAGAANGVIETIRSPKQ